MRTILAAVCLLTLGGVELRAELTVKQYKDMMASGVGDRVSLARIYLTGVGDGIVAANVMTDMKKKTSLFCQPQKLALGIDNYVRILDDAITRISTKMPQEESDQTPIVLMLLRGLEETFPCDTK
jgi:hypothetical protein